jgi:HlyD family secretion protein
VNINFLVIVAVFGILTGIFSVRYYYNSEQVTTEVPLSMSYSPYENGIYARGIIENPPGLQPGAVSPYLLVRSFVNEILVPNLPLTGALEATLFLRGGNFQGLPLEFVQVEPLVIPDAEFSNGARVLPVIFKFQKPGNYNIFPGQTVDVYIRGA